ncbi:MAG: bifunctional diaminohydroxyphosphoribosylaminopyrimidine deaminase/5-amino-6-(5-phosphoribosylamino)uracil reductase RibD [Akkermansiaceae bacterium]|nr:bifunctional diaminohydroxyphosphoribosylaminopyrimidine deaminase/5-amino-6-(5-phosphoribosylamino)uracil reductase RibD [Akkermansiaceae bacterium]NNM29121.1 bifunctional diaminohydroxyphosphoribosylaminopyrimidine deaminase/5-amino-6-(5-phosphoribosylamino)uracil reductase RibD [Akkermansiaceae bacterium]
MDDAHWMRQALALGRRGIGLTSPNPPVGAVVVRDGAQLAGGWHRRAGMPHAEIEAMAAARLGAGDDALEGATLYVTLEPCSTRGTTGACTEAIMAGGVKRVVFGATDPNPAHGGQAEEILTAAGIAVTRGVEEAACRALIRPFAKVQECGLPWVIVKTAMSLDGRITRPAGEGSWLSGATSRLDVQLLRSEVDAILTSGQTARQDNPRLTLRGPGLRDGKEQPLRVVLTSREDGVPDDGHLRRDEFANRTHVFAGRRIEAVLRELASEFAVQSILVEAGGRLLGRLLDEGWADELVVYLAPLLTGGEVPAVGGEGAESLAQRWRLGEVEFERFDDDVRLRGIVSGRGGGLER